jgi:hypothetical protein
MARNDVAPARWIFRILPLNRWTGVVVACERDAKDGVLRCQPPTTQR